MSNTRALIKFLKTKIKESLKEPEYYTLETSPATKKIENAFNRLPQEQQEKLRQELEADMQRGH